MFTSWFIKRLRPVQNFRLSSVPIFKIGLREFSGSHRSMILHLNRADFQFWISSSHMYYYRKSHCQLRLYFMRTVIASSCSSEYSLVRIIQMVPLYVYFLMRSANNILYVYNAWRQFLGFLVVFFFFVRSRWLLYHEYLTAVHNVTYSQSFVNGVNYHHAISYYPP